MAKGDKAALLDQFGIDEVCARLIAGESQGAIAKHVGVGLMTLIDWIAADPVRSARAREARTAAARQFDEKAEAELRDASDPFTLARAKELAHHFRWRASKVAPRDYGDKLAIGGAEDLPPLKNLSDDDLEARIRAKLEAMNASKPE